MQAHRNRPHPEARHPHPRRPGRHDVRPLSCPTARLANRKLTLAKTRSRSSQVGRPAQTRRGRLERGRTRHLDGPHGGLARAAEELDSRDERAHRQAFVRLPSLSLPDPPAFGADSVSLAALSTSRSSPPSRLRLTKSTPRSSSTRASRSQRRPAVPPRSPSSRCTRRRASLSSTSARVSGMRRRRRRSGSVSLEALPAPRTDFSCFG